MPKNHTNVCPNAPDVVTDRLEIWGWRQKNHKIQRGPWKIVLWFLFQIIRRGSRKWIPHTWRNPKTRDGQESWFLNFDLDSWHCSWFWFWKQVQISIDFDFEFEKSLWQFLILILILRRCFEILDFEY